MKITNKKKLVCIITTFEIEEKANRFANLLLQKQLAACVSIKEIRSSYLRKGSIEKNNEFQLLIKSLDDKLEDVISFIRSSHDYEVPEIIFWLVEASEEYLDWIKNEIN
tara:strand:- start:1459 stop:1785 length:327 start_codon:yes stop_codon:yes gene_type:complete